MRIEKLEERLVKASGLLFVGFLCIIPAIFGVMTVPESNIALAVLGFIMLFMGVVVFFTCYTEDYKDSWRDAVRGQMEKEEKEK
ncbi:MAG: hypothetical protein BAJATHORv1_60072 [Candidatus Thorarchaeota archaeon]|nr:MAG: hypothetical protein BAJATHORv1_60072 [Candidatus Thorarchaeota archaeon]